MSIENSPVIAVIGAGIGGLAAAFALNRAGFRTEVYEQSQTLRESGAVLGLRPRTVEILDEWGLGETYQKFASRFDAIQMLEGDTGQRLGEMRLGDIGVETVPWSEGIRRADLQRLFALQVPAAALHLGRRCRTVVDHGDCVDVEFIDGGTTSVAAVIGADGIHSTIRGLFAADDAVYSGVQSYPGAVRAELVQDLLPDELPSSWMRADGAFFLLMPAHHGEFVGFDAIIPEPHPGDDTWSRTISGEELLAKLHGFDPVVHEIIRRVEQPEFIAFGVHDRSPLSRWTAGRITLLGDAAHPLIPSEGQGVNLAIQDAAALADLLREVSPAEIPAVLQRYSALRAPIAQEIHRASRERHAQNGFAAEGR